ncbi:amino acid permease, partial [Pseudomonas paraeruginosa]|uniref:amino acid permease n=1 Tax=Pseudomonas paraeruginosa TaxID=2994495 RepID=UPI000B1FE328
VLVAVASCLNSAIYTSSRMVFSLARRGDAPGVLKLTNTAHVPRPAVLASTAVGFLTTIVNYFAPELARRKVKTFSGAVALLVYLVIAVAQLRMRKQLQASGQPIEFRMWLYPWLTWAVILFIVAALSIMLVMPEHRHEVFATALLTTMFSFMGTEIVTIAAAESKDPAKQITRATNSVIWRIGLFYLVSIFIVISIVPWNDPLLIQVGSYQRALELLDIPHA